MKLFLLTIGFLMIVFVTQGQSIELQRDEQPVKISEKLYKIDLKQPADCIQQIVYPKTGKPVDAELIDNGNTILIRNYHEGNSIAVTVLLKNGEQLKFNQNPCSLQVITPL